MTCLLSFLIVLQTTGLTPEALDPSASLGVAVTVDQRLYPALAAQGVQHDPVLPALPQGSPRSRQLRRGVLGGVIGAVAGVATCTLISNVFFNEGEGLSTCTTKGNLVFAGGGFAAGFAIGWFTGGDDGQE
jgi:hypothetical protein